MKKNVNYYTESIVTKFANAVRDALNHVRAEDPNYLKISISNGNSKMGPVASVSLMPFTSCPTACENTCGPKCYAARIANMYPGSLQAYARNTALACLRPDLYWIQVDAAVKAVRFFRFHVAGDIISHSYFDKLVQCAANNPHTDILIFTKQFEIVNQYIDKNGNLPDNLHLLFSGWYNLTPYNPHHLPETNVFNPDKAPADNWKICGGNCFECACRGVGCWQAKSGDVIAFNEH